MGTDQAKACEICKTQYSANFSYKLECLQNKIFSIPIVLLGVLLIGVVAVAIYWKQDHSATDPLFLSMIGLIVVIFTSMITVLFYVLKFECLKKYLVDFNENTTNQNTSRVAN